MSLWLMQSIWWKVQTACASIISIVWHWQSADVSVCLCAGSKTECLVLDQTSLFQRNPTALKHLDSNKYSGKNIYTTQTLYLHVKAFIINSLVFFFVFFLAGTVSIRLPVIACPQNIHLISFLFLFTRMNSGWKSPTTRWYILKSIPPKYVLPQ